MSRDVKATVRTLDEIIERLQELKRSTLVETQCTVCEPPAVFRVDNPFKILFKTMTITLGLYAKEE